MELIQISANKKNSHYFLIMDQKQYYREYRKHLQYKIELKLY